MLGMVIAILGRQPKIGLAELESVYGAKAVAPLGQVAASIAADAVDHARLGGTMKLGQPLGEVASNKWPTILKYIATQLPEWLATLPEGKLKLGISVYGVHVSSAELFRGSLELKKAARAQKRSVRVVPNTAPELNSAQVLHNQLTGKLGMELLIIAAGNTTIIARTTSVQNVDDYARRDQARPKRDAFVGMLPPKLAQIMLNLAKVQPGERVLDPFCGTGVVLQEAMLMGCQVYGADISDRMVRFTRDNLAWLQQTYHIRGEVFFEVADATEATWQQPVNHVVCETYLGQPLSGLPRPEKLAEIIRTCNTIITLFLKNLQPQLASGTRLCLAVPTWRVGNSFKQLSLIDDLNNLGYNRMRFQYANDHDLVYHREGQIVGRQLLVVSIK
jgi:tRNA (guanine10-N2)-dimethyltransferase